MIKNEYQLVSVRRADGTLTLMQFVVMGRAPKPPSGAYRVVGDWFRRDPIDENVAAEVEKSCLLGPPAIGWRRITEADLPTNLRYYRDALVDDGKVISHDMDKARALHLAVVRAVRAKCLGELDGQWMRAMGQKLTDEADAIEVERQKLRDLPSEIGCEKATTVEELLDCWSDLLGPKPG